MKYVVKIFGLLAWLTAVALTMALVHEFTADQDIVVTGVAGLAIVLSAFGLAFSRYSWQKRAYPEIGLGIAMWIAGATCLTFIEVSYWVSSYEARYEQYSQAKKAKARREARGDQAWNALLTGSIPVSPAQLEAQLDAKRLDPAIDRSADCTKVTRDDSRKVCQELFALQGQVAAAKKREQLESEIKIDAPVEQKRLSNNVFAIAELLARFRGGDVQDWAYVVMAWNWILLMLVRDGGLLVANPLGRERKLQEARKAEPRPDLARKRLPAVSVVPVELPAPVILPSEKVGQPFYAPTENGPDPDGGKPASVPVVAQNETTDGTSSQNEHVAENVVTIAGDPYEPEKRVSKRDIKRAKREQQDSQLRSIVERFVGERLDRTDPKARLKLTARGGHQSGGTAGEIVYTEFKKFCRDIGVPIVGRNHMGKHIGEFVPRAKNAKSVVYGCVVMSRAKQRRAA